MKAKKYIIYLNDSFHPIVRTNHFGINEIGVQSPDRCVIVTDGLNTALLMPVIYNNQKVYKL